MLTGDCGDLMKTGCPAAVEVAPAERTKEQLAQAKAAPAQVNVICKAKALYAYTAENRDEEIDLLEGDVILVEYKVRWQATV